MMFNTKGWKKYLGLAFGWLLASSGASHAMLAPGVGKDKALTQLKAEAVEGEFVLQMQKSASTSKATLKRQLLEIGMQLKAVVNAGEELYLVKVNNRAKTLSLAGEKNLRTAALSLLNTMSGVQFAEPNFIYRAQAEPAEILPPGGSFSKLWGMKNIGQPDPAGRVGIPGADISATKAWALAQGSKDVVVAVIDTGIDYNHPALKDNMWTKPKASPSDPTVYGYNAITDVENPFDDHSHGTHCAGTIGASGLNPNGVVGVTWNVRLMGVKFLSESGSGSLADAIKAIDWAVAHGAHILSNSWGGGGFSEALRDAITRARDKGVLFVAAAGNNGVDMDKTPGYPASYEIDNVLAVAATNNSDELAYFSNYGVGKVKIAAPGMNIFSSVPGPDGYASFSGTSMACPHVAGAAALLLGKEPSLTYAELKNRIVATADKLPGLRKKVGQGARLNVFNMLMNIQPPAPIGPPDESWSVVVPNVIESDHPYKDSAKQSWTISQPGATYLKIKFGKVDTEAGYDAITIKNSKGVVVDSVSGALGDKGFLSAEIDGDRATIEFTSDSSVSRWGFVIEGYTWSAFNGNP